MERNTSTSSYLPPILFSVTLFTSAGLLFWIQPLIAKTLLPHWGGTPAVWNTCLLFFQTMLLIGYVYALASSRWFGIQAQAVVHIVLISLIAIYLFWSQVQSGTQIDLQGGNPTLGVLETLLISIGLPFFVISASNPLLQSWFSRLQHDRAVDPYFLFAASNGGSLMALVAFPLVFEPTLGLDQQYKLWRLGFATLVILILAIALSLRLLATAATGATEKSSAKNTQSSRPSGWRRMHWVALAFVPSSLMLGVTTYITADVASVPLLWVIPLTLYLLTFVLAFTSKSRALISRAVPINRVMFVGALVVMLILSTSATEPAWILILANLAFFFVATLTCHIQLANDRPTTTHLAEYYLWIAVGGALGSLFNVLVAPILFRSVLEYPLAIALACMLQAGERTDNHRITNEREIQRNKFALRKHFIDALYPLALFLLTASLAMLVLSLRPISSTIKLLIVPGIPFIILNHFFRHRPVRFGLGLCAVMLASFYTGKTDRTLLVSRNFFGTIRVTTDSAGKTNTFFSGNTVHGREFVDPSRQCEPISYHHENGPLGQVMAVYNAHPANPHVGVVGLGVGAMAAYSKPDQEWTFYEINPDVIKTARDARYFSYLQKCAKAPVNIVAGDARLSLQDAPVGYYGLIVLDAFSSDAIPVHLITQQALDLYLSKLADGGMLVFNVSSRSLNLGPVLADLVESRNLTSISFDDSKPGNFEGKDPSHWVVMARHESEISYLSINSQWKQLRGTKGARSWSDDFSNIVQAIKWLGRP